jgi:hypothetical protein
MTNLILSNVVRTLIAADVAAVEKTSKTRHALIDALVAAGHKSTDFISPKSKLAGSTATPEMYGELKEAIVAGFTVADQALIKVTSPAAVAALKPEKAARRTYVQQQIGSRMKDYKNALARRETPADDNGAGGRKRPSYDRFMDHLTKAINILRDDSDFPFDVPEMSAFLAKAEVHAKAGAARAKTKK